MGKWRDGALRSVTISQTIPPGCRGHAGRKGWLLRAARPDMSFVESCNRLRERQKDRCVVEISKPADLCELVNRTGFRSTAHQQPLAGPTQLPDDLLPFWVHPPLRKRDPSVHTGEGPHEKGGKAEEREQAAPALTGACETPWRCQEKARAPGELAGCT